MKVFFISFFALVLASGVSSSVVDDIFKGLLRTGKYRTIFRFFSQSTLRQLENDENEGATFICQLAAGNVPDALAGLGEDVVDQVQDDLGDLISFVQQLPDMVPDLIHDFEQGVVDVADAVSGLVVNPSSEVSALWDDFTSDVESVWHGLTCDVEEWFGGSCSGSATSSASEVWQTQCASITTAVPTAVAAATTTYASASPSAYPSACASSTSSTESSSPTSDTGDGSSPSSTTSPALDSTSSAAKQAQVIVGVCFSSRSSLAFISLSLLLAIFACVH